MGSFQPSSRAVNALFMISWKLASDNLLIIGRLGGVYSYCMQGISWELTDLKRLDQVGLCFSTNSPKCRKTRAHVQGCSQPSIPFYRLSDRSS